MDCEKCGKTLENTMTSCIHCGHDIGEEKDRIILKKVEIKETIIKRKINLEKEPFDDLIVKRQVKLEEKSQNIINSKLKEEQSEVKSYCPYCGRGNDGQSAFCANCGSRLSPVELSSDTNTDNTVPNHSAQNENSSALSGIEMSAYQLKVNPAYPVYVPQTLEEKRAVVALNFWENWNRVTKEKGRVLKGRASRREYWLAAVSIICTNIVLSFLIEGVDSRSNGSIIVGLLALGALIIVNLWFIIPSFMLTIRRCHDIGKSGWWMLVTVIPYVGSLYFLYLMCQKGDAHINQYGKPENYYVASDYEKQQLGM